MVHAITSAGVVSSITMACSKGNLENCACDPKKVGRGRDRRSEFVWGGCSDNTKYGIDFTRLFVDARDKIVRDARALMNLQNNGAGRRVRFIRQHLSTSLSPQCNGWGLDDAMVLNPGDISRSPTIMMSHRTTDKFQFQRWKWRTR